MSLFMFAEETILGVTYLDILEIYIFPQIDYIELEKEILCNFLTR